MKAREYFTEVVLRNIAELRADTSKSYQRVWNAATSLDQVADHAALEQLGYQKQWLQAEIKDAVDKIVGGTNELKELRVAISNPLKHVRSHTRDAKTLGYVFAATTSAVENTIVQIKRGDGSVEDYDAILKKIEAAEAYWRRYFGL